MNLQAFASVAAATALAAVLAGCGEDDYDRAAAYPPGIGYSVPATSGQGQLAVASTEAPPSPAPQFIPPPPDGQDASAGLPSDEEYVDNDPSALTDFRTTLDPYGNWVDDPNYGTVWVPSNSVVGSDFTPYVSGGHWGYDSDYVWVSDYDWGWAPFHYGRWVYGGGGYGWEWIPGRTYAGAWVSWRYGWGDWGYVGWAPLGPTWGWRNGVAVGLGFVPQEPYGFCGTGNLFAPHIVQHMAGGAQVGQIAAHTQPYVPAQPKTNGRTPATPTVGGPSPRTLGIPAANLPPSAIADCGVVQARLFARPNSAVALGGRPPLGSQPGTFTTPRGTRYVGSASDGHFGGRLGYGFRSDGMNMRPTYAPRPYTGGPSYRGGTGAFSSRTLGGSTSGGAKSPAVRVAKVRARVNTHPGTVAERFKAQAVDASCRTVAAAPSVPQVAVQPAAAAAVVVEVVVAGTPVAATGVAGVADAPYSSWALAVRRREVQTSLKLGSEGGRAMRAGSIVRSVGVAAAFVGLAVGCVVNSTDGTGSGGYGGPGPSASEDAGSTASPNPVLVLVDPNQTLNATPGDGVGVFVEYQTGGHWNVSWTCDTNKTGLACNFDNTVSVSTGTIANVVGQTHEQGDRVQLTGSQSVEVTTVTNSFLDGITFDTPLVGAAKPIITLDVKLSGTEQSGFIFFVQDGQVNGGYSGQLTGSADARAVESLSLVVVGFGANLGGRLSTMRTALRALGRVGRVEKTSQVYETEPVGPPQPDYLNAAARVAFEGEPEVLLDALLAIEASLGRVREVPLGPRTIDLDVLWIRGVTLATPRLVVPHPRLHERAFAVLPLLNVVPGAIDPRTGRVYQVPAGNVRDTGDVL